METCLLNKYCINVLHMKICTCRCILVGPEENHHILMLVAFKHLKTPASDQMFVKELNQYLLKSVYLRMIVEVDIIFFLI